MVSVTEDQRGTDPDTGPDEDLEYDLAHEARESADSPGREGTADPISVPTQTPGYSGGDYSYDMAHDIPAP